MPDFARLMRETAGATYFRQRPAEAVRYGWSKARFARHRVSPDGLLALLGFDVLSARAGLEHWAKDLNAVIERVNARSTTSGLDQGGVSYEAALFQYGLVRSLRPDVVIETGVAAGLSTSFLGAALIENGTGVLVSIDLPPQEVVLDDGAHFDWRDSGVGWAIAPRVREGLGDRHQLILEDVRTALPRVLTEFPQIDCFIHDDLHTPDHMRWEFELVWPKLRPGGVIAADDVNQGWTTFARGKGRHRIALANTQRFAALRKPLD